MADPLPIAPGATYDPFALSSTTAPTPPPYAPATLQTLSALADMPPRYMPASPAFEPRRFDRNDDNTRHNVADGDSDDLEAGPAPRYELVVKDDAQRRQDPALNRKRRPKSKGQICCRIMGCFFLLLVIFIIGLIIAENIH